MSPKFISEDLLAEAIIHISSWTGKVQKQYSRHIWSILPPKAKSARPGTRVDYEEYDDFQFMDRFLRLEGTGTTHPYFDPFTREWLPTGYPHSNLATFRKKTFVRSWHAAEWDGSKLSLVNGYGKIFEGKVLSKGGTITRIPALPVAVWFYKNPSTEWPGIDLGRSGLPATSTELVALFRREFNFDDDAAWFSIFDPSTDIIRDYEQRLSENSHELDRDAVRVVCVGLTAPVAGIATKVSKGQQTNTRVALADELTDELRLDELVFPDQLIRRITAALTHSHVRLLGPPGTGKTTLARAILRSIVDDNFAFTVATGQWTSDDVVGGPVPAEDDPTKLVFRPGVILEAADNNRWIGIDEINRADIDSAFGELFGLLAGFDIDLPYLADAKSKRRIKIYAERPEGVLQNGEYGLPKSWRMIATMNSWDKVSLNRVSFAFSRRWCTVFVPVPDPIRFGELLESMLDAHPTVRSMELSEALDYLFVEDSHPETPSLRELGMAMGPGIAKSCILDIEANLVQGISPGDALALSIDGFVLPQFEGALEVHDGLSACLSRALRIADTSSELIDELDGKLSVFTGRSESSVF